MNWTSSQPVGKPDKFAALVKTDKLSTLVKLGKMDKQGRTSFQPGKNGQVRSLGKIGQNGQARSDQFSALVKTDKFAALVKLDKSERHERTSKIRPVFSPGKIG
jgi:hypothetical protein